MQCKCGGDTGVIDTRTTQGGAIRRRRSCNVCEERFTTYEVEEGRRNPVQNFTKKPLIEKINHLIYVADKVNRDPDLKNIVENVLSNKS